jgi:hypothetical protein
MESNLGRDQVVSSKTVSTLEHAMATAQERTQDGNALAEAVN